MARCAVEIELILHFEVGQVRERDVHILAGGRGVFAGKSASFGEARILDLFGRVATAAAFGRQIGVELRLHARLGVAGGALLMLGKAGELALLVELMAKGTIGAETGLGVDASFGIDVRACEKSNRMAREPL